MARRTRWTRITLSGALACWLAVIPIGFERLQAAEQQAAPARAATSPRAVLDRYCVTCHNERLKTADLVLDKLDVDDVPSHAETWEKVVRKLRTGAMPSGGPAASGQGDLRLDRRRGSKPRSTATPPRGRIPGGPTPFIA